MECTSHCLPTGAAIKGEMEMNVPIFLHSHVHSSELWELETTDESHEGEV